MTHRAIDGSSFFRPFSARDEFFSGLLRTPPDFEATEERDAGIAKVMDWSEAPLTIDVRMPPPLR